MQASDKVTPPIRARAVAVVGAGLAGLACAQRLQTAGIPVTLFDQADTPGGRMRRCVGDGWQCDHGAQYFTARNPAFVALVNEWIAAGVAARWPARVASWDGAEFRPSQSALTRFVGVPDMAAPARALAADLDVRSRTDVRVLQRGGQGWVLEVAGEDAMRACDTVLLAVPAPYAAALSADIAPALSTIARDARMQP
ncbi:FAD-dependent oxidoreductase, partial [Xanthomonas fragariae]